MKHWQKQETKKSFFKVTLESNNFKIEQPDFMSDNYNIYFKNNLILENVSRIAIRELSEIGEAINKIFVKNFSGWSDGIASSIEEGFK